MASFTEELKSAFREGNTVIRLIFINVAVYVAINVIYVGMSLFDVPTKVIVCGPPPIDKHWLWLGVPADLSQLLFKPWTLITYMFGHAGLWHLAWNMVVLFFSGRIFMEYLSGTRVLATYIFGGLGGIALYLIFYNIFPAFSTILPCSKTLGASASVMAILIAVTAYVPGTRSNYRFSDWLS